MHNPKKSVPNNSSNTEEKPSNISPDVIVYQSPSNASPSTPEHAMAEPDHEPNHDHEQEQEHEHEINESDHTITTEEESPHRPSTPNQNLDDVLMDGASDSSPNSSPSQFKLPDSILKNLTPLGHLGKSHRRYSDERYDMIKKRRQSLLEFKRDKLLAKSKLITEKLRKLSETNISIRNDKLIKLHTDYSEAKDRRQKYLDRIKRRASHSNSIMENFHLIQDQIKSSPSINTDIIITTTSVPSTSSVPSTVPTRTTEEQFDKYVHEKYIKEVSSKILNSGILDNFDQRKSKEVFTLFGKDSSYRNEIRSILYFYNIPQLSRSYRTFFYAFLMICEFKECVFKKMGYHPSFNTNLPNQETRNFIKNFIWLLLFKFANEVIADFKILLKTGSNELLLKSWKSYTFVFKIFKGYDYQDLHKMINSAINTVNTQIDLVGDEDDDDESLADHRDNFVKEKNQLESLYDESLDQFFGDEETQVFLSAIDHELRFDDGTFRNTISVKSFYLPKMKHLSKSQWRKFWFNYYLNKGPSNSKILMRSGILKSNIETKNNIFVSIDDVYKCLGLNRTNQEKSDTIQVSELVNLVYSIFLDLCLFYNKSGKSISPSRLKFKVTKESQDKSNGYGLIQEHLLMINELISIVSPDDYIMHEHSKKCSDIFQQGTLDDETVRKQLTYNLREFESLVSSLLLNSYNVHSFENLVQIETSHLIYSSPYYNALNSKMFVSSPHMLFPKFYRFLKAFDHRNKLDLNNYLHILDSTYRCRLQVNPTSLGFFKHLYFDLVCHEYAPQYLLPDELNVLYLEDLQGLNREIGNFIESNALVYVTYGITSMNVSDRFTEVVAYFTEENNENNENKDNKGDLRSFLIETLGISATDAFRVSSVMENTTQLRTVYYSKLLQGLKKDGQDLQQYFSTVFPWSKTQSLQLVTKIQRLVEYVVQVYGQIFSWIYDDLGRPQ
ncbi:uncharacterized protein RJT21DRAFT_16656 [Scheffersomyces amazonensis]|uniref:uncharacterized protein n=1 Tax=Scheffersomyces amazonensis TaxID=1078765 RepID=UPI00315D9C83